MRHFSRRILAASVATILVTGCSQDAKVTKLGEHLRRMDSDVEVGINYEAYGNELRDLNFAAQEVSKAGLGDDAFRKEADEAVSLYRDAGTIWAAKISGPSDKIVYRVSEYSKSGKPLWLFDADDELGEGDEVVSINKILESRRLLVGRKTATLDDAVQELWKLAGDHSEKALADIE